MKTTLQKWGNSQGIRLPKDLVDQLGWKLGLKVDLGLLEGANEIRIRAVAASRPVRGRYRIEDLVAKISPGGHIGEVKWGKPRGKETW